MYDLDDGWIINAQGIFLLVRMLIYATIFLKQLIVQKCTYKNFLGKDSYLNEEKVTN